MAGKTYVVVKSMTVKGGGGVPKEFVKDAPKIMTKAALSALKSASTEGDDKGDKKRKGFSISAVLNKVDIDPKAKSVTCDVSGYVSTWPEDQMVAPGLSSKPKLKGEFDEAAARDCIGIAVESVIKEKVLGALKTLGPKHNR
jgi:hypothetical protein